MVQQADPPCMTDSGAWPCVREAGHKMPHRNGMGTSWVPLTDEEIAELEAEGELPKRRESNPVRTDMNCTNCSKNFIAELDMGLDGNHVVECPYCGHEHCRVITAGVVTGDRWESRLQRHDVQKRCVWKADSQPIFTNTAAQFIRQKWLDRLEPQP